MIDRMQAIVRRDYGPPDVLRFEEIEKPAPADDEVLIKVRAASVNPLDWHFLEGTPYPIRIMTGMSKPKETQSWNHPALVSCRIPRLTVTT